MVNKRIEILGAGCAAPSEIEQNVAVQTFKLFHLWGRASFLGSCFRGAIRDRWGLGFEPFGEVKQGRFADGGVCVGGEDF